MSARRCSSPGSPAISKSVAQPHMCTQHPAASARLTASPVTIVLLPSGSRCRSSECSPKLNRTTSHFTLPSQAAVQPNPLDAGPAFVGTCWHSYCVSIGNKTGLQPMEMLSPITSSCGLVLFAGDGLPPPLPQRLLSSAWHRQPRCPGAQGPNLPPTVPMQYVHTPRVSGHCTSDSHARPQTVGWLWHAGGAASSASSASSSPSIPSSAAEIQIASFPHASWLISLF
jgi:hypothetical protein